MTECQSVIQTMEERLESVAHEDDYAYSIMNELANTLRKHENFELSAQFYKKALLCVKRRYKQDYLNQFGTAKVLVNLATVHYLLKNVPESIKYYKHAIEVLENIEKCCNPKDSFALLAELGKAHMSFGNLYIDLKDSI